MKKTMLFNISLLLFLSLANPAALKLSVSHQCALGNESLVIEQLRSIVTSSLGDVYLLDGRARTVYHFNARGQQIGRFGKEGEGPGEFRSVGSMVMDGQNRLFISEHFRYLSQFDLQGSFVNRLDLDNLSGIQARAWQYAGPDLFYCERMVDGALRQILVDGKGQVSDIPLFVLKDSPIRVTIGGAVAMYRIRIPDSTPNLIFCHAAGMNVMAFSKEYHVKLIDERGQLKSSIKKDIPLQKFNEQEKADVEALISGLRIPQPVKDAAIKQMSPYKNVIDQILVSKGHVWVVRVKEDISDSESPFPLDVYNHEGGFLGQVFLPHYPLWIDSGSIYHASQR